MIAAPSDGVRLSRIGCLVLIQLLLLLVLLVDGVRGVSSEGLVVAQWPLPRVLRLDHALRLVHVHRVLVADGLQNSLLQLHGCYRYKTVPPPMDMLDVLVVQIGRLVIVVGLVLRHRELHELLDSRREPALPNLLLFLQLEVLDVNDQEVVEEEELADEDPRYEVEAEPVRLVVLGAQRVAHYQRPLVADEADVDAYNRLEDVVEIQSTRLVVIAVVLIDSTVGLEPGWHNLAIPILMRLVRKQLHPEQAVHEDEYDHQEVEREDLSKGVHQNIKDLLQLRRHKQYPQQLQKPQTVHHVQNRFETMNKIVTDGLQLACMIAVDQQHNGLEDREYDH